jgi:hypothetical protein
MKLDPRFLARALGANASGHNVLVPVPGHSPEDRSLSIRLDSTAPDGFIVHSFAGGAGIMRELQPASVPAVGGARAKLGKPRKSTSEIAEAADE